MRFALLLLPLIELFTLIELGIKTSALTAVVYVLATAAIGVLVLQRQGRGMFERLRAGGVSTFPRPEVLLDDLGMAFAGLLLIFPGLITDAIAVLVMTGPLCRRIARVFTPSKGGNFARRHERDSRATIDGEWRRIDDHRFP